MTHSFDTKNRVTSSANPALCLITPTAEPTAEQKDKNPQEPIPEPEDKDEPKPILEPEPLVEPDSSNDEVVSSWGMKWYNCFKNIFANK